MSGGFPQFLNSQSQTPQTGNGVSQQGARERSSGGLGYDLFLGRDASGRASAPFDYQRPRFDHLRVQSAADLGSGQGGLEHHPHPQQQQQQQQQQPQDRFTDVGQRQVGAGVVRSRSAQPAAYEDRRSAIGLPPGIPTARPTQSQGNVLAETSGMSYSSSGGVQRSASTGVIGSQNEALRPSARTLVDLIQEDYPDKRQGVSRQEGASPSLERQSESPVVSRSPRTENYGGYSSPNGQSYVHARNRNHGLQRQEYVIDEGEYYDQSPLDVWRQKILQQQQQQQEQPQSPRFPGEIIGRRISPAEEFTSQPYQQLTHQKHGGLPPPPQQQQQQQQVYYDDQIQQQRVDAHVYVNAPAQQSRYGYTTVRYHTQGPQTQVIHSPSIQPGLQAANDPFVSVVPVQGGPQIAYWQAEQQQQQQALGSQMSIVNQHPGHPGSSVHVNRLSQQPLESASHHSHGSAYGRPRGGDNKAGRGRRGGRRGDSKGGAHMVVSPLLEEFRASRVRDWTMYHIEGHVVEFCQDQNGSRFIQQRLELGDPMEQEVVMKEVLPAIRRLRNDVFGNYVVQKLLDFGTPRMKNDIRKTLEGEMLQLSLQMYGCRVVQKALEALDEETLPYLLQEFHHNVLSCIHDQNGNHVIQKCIEVINTRAKKAEQDGEPDRAEFLRDQVAFVVDDVLVNAAALSCHPYGCRVLQRILEHCDEEKKVAVLNEIRKSHQRLLDDQYGNYVIQHVLQFGRDSDRDSILAIVAENGLLELSRQKFASNVVEKLLKYGNGPQRQAIAREMLKVSK